MKTNTKTVVIIGTMDTKAAELSYLEQQVKNAGCQTLLMDVGAKRNCEIEVDIPVEKVVGLIGEDIKTIQALPRGEAVEKICQAAAACLTQLVSSNKVQGIIGLGGSGGTTICCTAMRALPYGIPKYMVSTLASGNTRWHVDISDIVMIPSILDIGGLNPMLQMVLNNAANGIAGATRGYETYSASGKKVVSATMYGTTTPGVSRACQCIKEAGHEPWVFHASGVGGRSMETLMNMQRIDAVMDMTLAEIGAHLVGGLHDAGPDRLRSAASLGLPQVIVPGAADTIVLPPRNQVPKEFFDRTLNFHNPTMTTMRTTVDENVSIAKFIAKNLNQAKGPVCVILPLGGVSSIDMPGKIFYDPKANDALFTTLKGELADTIEIIEDEHHLDAPDFAIRVADKMITMLI